MRVYYNEIDPFAAAWLRELVKDGLIPDGHIDERSIAEVRPDDLREFDQCHFFAGIGGWPYALNLAGWEGPVWTGSCPCQPFSGAGKRKGFGDSRHLWPTWFRLIRECRPPVVFGEQVASQDGLGWFDTVSTDLEAEGYAVGAADLCAAGVGAPHIRQRLYFVAHSNRERREGERLLVRERGSREAVLEAAGSSGVGLLGEPGSGAAQEIRPLPGQGPSTESRGSSALVDSDGGEPSDRDLQRSGEHGQQPQDDGAGFWSDLVWLPCSDGKARPTKSGIFPLAHGVPNRMGTLRGAGNAITPQIAEKFIRAAREAIEAKQ